MHPFKRRQCSDKRNRDHRRTQILPKLADALAIMERTQDPAHPTLRCICCDKQLHAQGRNDDEPSYQPDNGVMCTTHGNYGSTVFDSVYHKESLLFFVCDGCLVKKATNMFVFQEDRTEAITLKEYLDA